MLIFKELACREEVQEMSETVTEKSSETFQEEQKANEKHERMETSTGESSSQLADLNFIANEAPEALTLEKTKAKDNK